MEGSIARWYEKTTRKDMAEFRQLAARIANIVPADGDILEVAQAGFLMIELAKMNRFRVTGLDISKTFVDLARKKADELGVKVNFEHGTPQTCRFLRKASTSSYAVQRSKTFPSLCVRSRRCTGFLSQAQGCDHHLRRDALMPEIASHVDKMG